MRESRSARSGPARATHRRGDRHEPVKAVPASRSGAVRAQVNPAVLRIELQLGVKRSEGVPGPVRLRRWARAAWDAGREALPRGRRHEHAPETGIAPTVCVRVVGNAESRRLNDGFRGKASPTNVLSFPASSAERLYDGALGDLVVCAPVVAREAREQGKPLSAHWAHMVVHGMLHLLGYDHEQARAAARMEKLEVEILRRLGFHDPYLQVTHARHE
jgi:probable rRNA maturation factor